VFARIANGSLYAVGIDLNPIQNYCIGDNCNYTRTNPLYMTPVKLNRAWLNLTLNAAGSWFADLPHQTPDFDFPASIYLEGRSITTENWKAPVLISGSGPVTPSPTNPSPTNPTPPTPSPTNPSPTNPSPTNPSPGPSASVTLGLSQDVILWGSIGLGGFLLLLVLIIIIVKK